jgi:hypothetical protein
VGNLPAALVVVCHIGSDKLELHFPESSSCIALISDATREGGMKEVK